MRGNLLILIVLIQCLFALMQPRIGLYAYIWFGLMRPDFIAFVPGRFNLSALLAVVTLFSALRYFENIRFLVKPLPVMLMALILAVGVSAHSGYFHGYSMQEFYRYLRMWIMCLAIPLLITEESHFRELFYVTAASLGFLGLWWGFTAGIRGMRIWYGPGGFLSDNNSFAVAMAMIVPFLWHARTMVKPMWAKVVFSAMMMGSVVVVILTYSRGGALALATVFLLLLMRSKYRMRSLALIVIAVLPVLGMVGAAYKERLSTIQTYESDQSAEERIQQMKIAYEIWKTRPILGIGVGDENYLAASRPYLDKLDANVIVHNSFLQILVHTGIVGFTVFTLMVLTALWTSWKLGQKMWKTDRERAVFPVTLFVSLVAYVVASMTHPRAWFDFYYMLVMYCAAWSGIVQRKEQAAKAAIAAMPAQGQLELKLPQRVPAVRPMVRFHKA